MTQPEEAMHDSDGPERDEHLGSENPHRAPVKPANDPSHTDLPDNDLDQPTEEVPDRARRDMH